ncbi:hypothetical protein OS190_11215 [Sulfitobacter sp. F26204]|uniref:hypothetical protein n=1 Tax=Sulfitobacter sp. F26204 TaxID=2996014 RepID=UPI00225E19D5|nr:hypothetical protein [Sulfitobacter sp. F26204]MCX7560139.1 hypothetical protein [Sulfitobacter sp. F26204]
MTRNKDAKIPLKAPLQLAMPYSASLVRKDPQGAAVSLEFMIDAAATTSRRKDEIAVRALMIDRLPLGTACNDINAVAFVFGASALALGGVRATVWAAHVMLGYSFHGEHLW